MTGVEGAGERAGPRANEALGFRARPHGRGAVADQELHAAAAEARDAARRVDRIDGELNTEPARDADVGQGPRHGMDGAEAEWTGLGAERCRRRGQREPTQGDPQQCLTPRHD
jgi:hypothetical protein